MILAKRLRALDVLQVAVWVAFVLLLGALFAVESSDRDGFRVWYLKTDLGVSPARGDRLVWKSEVVSVVGLPGEVVRQNRGQTLVLRPGSIEWVAVGMAPGDAVWQSYYQALPGAAQAQIAPTLGLPVPEQAAAALRTVAGSGLQDSRQWAAETARALLVWQPENAEARSTAQKAVNGSFVPTGSRFVQGSSGASLVPTSELRPILGEVNHGR